MSHTLTSLDALLLVITCVETWTLLGTMINREFYVKIMIFHFFFRYQNQKFFRTTSKIFGFGFIKFPDNSKWEELLIFITINITIITINRIQKKSALICSFTCKNHDCSSSQQLCAALLPSNGSPSMKEWIQEDEVVHVHSLSKVCLIAKNFICDIFKSARSAPTKIKLTGNVSS